MSVNAGHPVRRLADERPTLSRPKVLYADLDGTLLGPGGSLLTASDGSPSLAAATALTELRMASVDLVVMSGRTRRSAELARALGASAFIGELGAVLVEAFVPEHAVVHNFGAYRGRGSPAEAMARSGAAALLLERFPGRLRPVASWTEASIMLHGHVDAAEATGALAEGGHGWLELHDNGRLRRTYPDLKVSEVHAYHLLPRGVTKASAVRLHRERHGIAVSESAAVGDSPSDLLVAPEVGAFFLVANGLASVGDAAGGPENAYVTAGSHGEGFAEAVAALLSQ